jgi:protocatechuate 3,4-dioxygenase beta subunit
VIRESAPVIDLENLPLSRRRALGLLGGLGLAAFLPGCADDEPAATAADAGTGTGGDAGAGAVDCVLMPEVTEGPYYLDIDLVRSDITESRPGLPLDLRVTVVDADACEPIADAAVDVWHCDAGGVYSGVEGADGETFCRGVQMTDADGVAEFRTIFPGWYAGRAVHIHVKVIPGAGEAHTGQLFFEDQRIAAAYESEPYAERSGPETTNSADGIYAETDGSTVVALVSAGDGYTGAITLGVRRA